MRHTLSLFAAAVLLLASAGNVDAQALITTIAGGGPSDGPALETPLGSPSDVALDGAGNLFIVANSLNRIIKVDTTGQATMFAGISESGFSGDGGPAASARLASPRGVAVDSDGNVYIADESNHRIRKVDAATGVITTVAGNGIAGFSGDGGLATGASLNNPFGVAVDGAGNLYIGDRSNQRVRKVDGTGVITTVAGDGNAGFSGDLVQATSTSLQNPRGVAVHAGSLFIADQSNNRVRRVNLNSGVIRTVAGDGSFASSGDGGLATSAAVANPRGVTVDSAGNLFIAELSGHKVRRVDAATRIITTVAGTGIPGFTGDGGLAAGATLANPSGVAVDSDGNLFIADEANQRLRAVDAATDVITTLAGNGTCCFGGDGGTATDATLSSPIGVAPDSAGNVFIVDFDNQRIRRVDAATGAITTVAGDGNFDSTGDAAGDGGPATGASLANPRSVAVDSAGNIFIADQLNQRVRKVDAATGVITTVAGDGIAGYSGDLVQATDTSLNNPRGVAVHAGSLFIADQDNHRVRRVNLNSGVIRTVAGNGIEDFSGDGGHATSASLASPRAVAVDSAGNLFIADVGNHRIRRVDAVTRVITTVAGNGIEDFSGDGGPATNASLASPFGIAVDSAGDLFIADLLNHRIRKVDAATGVITTVVGDGSRGFSGDGGPATSAMLADPSSVAVDSAGTLFIADLSNDRIRMVSIVADLIETAVSDPPATVLRGDTFSVTDTVLNQGQVGTTLRTTTRYYLSADREKNTGDRRLTGSRSVPPLNPGLTSTDTVTVTVPGSTAFGLYFLLACADDVGARVAESDETNNCLASATRVRVAGPDLVERAVTRPPATATRGTSFRVTDTVVNRGGQLAAATTTRYYLSVDGLRNAGDRRLIGTRDVPQLAPGATSRARVTVTIPATTPFGTYFLLACADDVAPKVKESSETNNCGVSTTAMELTGPDLVERAVSAPPTAAPGTSFLATDTVKNLGGGPATATTTRYYLSVDKRRNAGDTLLTGARLVPPLNPGAASAGTATVTIPAGTAAGTYFLIACADRVAPRVAEIDETNNCGASAGTIVVGP